MTCYGKRTLAVGSPFNPFEIFVRMSLTVTDWPLDPVGNCVVSVCSASAIGPGIIFCCCSRARHTPTIESEKAVTMSDKVCLSCSVKGMILSLGCCEWMIPSRRLFLSGTPAAMAFDLCDSERHLVLGLGRMIQGGTICRFPLKRLLLAFEPGLPDSRAESVVRRVSFQ